MSGAKGFLSFIKEGKQEKPPQILKITKTDDIGHATLLSQKASSSNDLLAKPKPQRADKNPSFFSRFKSPNQPRARSSSVSDIDPQRPVEELKKPKKSESNKEKTTTSPSPKSPKKNSVKRTSFRRFIFSKQPHITKSEILEPKKLPIIEEEEEGIRRRTRSMSTTPFFSKTPGDDVLDSANEFLLKEITQSPEDIELSFRTRRSYSWSNSREFDVNFRTWYKQMLKEHMEGNETIKSSSTCEKTENGHILSEGTVFLRRGIPMENRSVQFGPAVIEEDIRLAATARSVLDRKITTIFKQNSIENSVSCPSSPFLTMVPSKKSTSEERKISKNKKSASWVGPAPLRPKPPEMDTSSLENSFHKQYLLQRKHELRMFHKRQKAYKGIRSSIKESGSQTEPDKPRRYSSVNEDIQLRGGTLAFKSTSDSSYNSSGSYGNYTEILQNKINPLKEWRTPAEISALSGLTPPASPAVSKSKYPSLSSYNNSNPYRIRRAISKEADSDDSYKLVPKGRQNNNEAPDDRERCSAPDPIMMLSGGLSYDSDDFASQSSYNSLNEVSFSSFGNPGENPRPVNFGEMAYRTAPQNSGIMKPATVCVNPQSDMERSNSDNKLEISPGSAFLTTSNVGNVVVKDRSVKT